MTLSARKKRYLFAISRLLGVTLILAFPSAAMADGTETLGPPSVAIASGSGVVAAGTGLEVQPGQIDLNVPGVVKQVLLYWSGEYTAISDSEIDVNGILVSGTSIGGPKNFFSNVFFETFRADITGLGLIGPGANSLTIQGLTYDSSNSGAGILVIVDDGSGDAGLEIRDAALNRKEV